MATTSPKRKRDQGAIPQLQTNQPVAHSRLHSDAQHRGGDSPRTFVAGRLQQLDLDSEVCSGLEPAEQDRKRARGDEGYDGPDSSPCPPADRYSTSQQHEPALQGFTFKHPEGMPEDTPVSASEVRPGSPSLSGEVNDLYWMDAEITGHDPDDPTDDGYGINGIGFRPTAGQAYQRAQRRKQQLAEYRSRETKEARQRRSERRRTAPAEGLVTTPREDKKARVHFEDG
jgi:hypothetical protein